MTDLDPFEVLDLDRGASDEEVREAGLVLGQQWRIRRQNARDEEARLEAERNEAEVQEAVRMLLDPASRRQILDHLDGTDRSRTDDGSRGTGGLADGVPDPGSAGTTDAGSGYPTHKRCRACAESILFEAMKCRFCGEDQARDRGGRPEVLALLVLALLGGGWGYLEAKSRESGSDSSVVRENNPPPAAEAPWTPPPAPEEPAGEAPEAEPEAEAFVPGEERRAILTQLEIYVSSTDNIDPERRAGLYAPLIDSYFGLKQVPRERVQNDMRKVAERFPNQHFVWVTEPEVRFEGATEAVVRFEKRWDFIGPDRLFNGAERVRMRFRRYGSEWLIASEDEEVVHYATKKALVNGVWKSL